MAYNYNSLSDEEITVALGVQGDSRLSIYELYLRSLSELSGLSNPAATPNLEVPQGVPQGVPHDALRGVAHNAPQSTSWDAKDVVGGTQLQIAPAQGCPGGSGEGLAEGAASEVAQRLEALEASTESRLAAMEERLKDFQAQAKIR